MAPRLAGFLPCVVALLAALPVAAASSRARWFGPDDSWDTNSTIGTKTRGTYDGALVCDTGAALSPLPPHSLSPPPYACAIGRTAGLDLWRLELDTKVPSGDVGGDICGYRNVGCFGYKLAVATGTPIQPVVFEDRLLAGTIHALRATFMGVHQSRFFPMNVALNEHVVETEDPIDKWGGCTWTTGAEETTAQTDFSWYKFGQENVMNLFWDPTGSDWAYSCISNVLVEFCVDRSARQPRPRCAACACRPPDPPPCCPAACLPGERLFPNRTGCATCAEGTYSDEEMAASCTECPKGTYGNTTGA